MSQTKAQLIQPIGVVTASGIVVSGVVTASSFDGDVVGSATSIISGSNLNVGIISATNFSGDFTGNATGIITGAAIKVGSFTATSFTGDFTGTATSMKRGTGFKAGAVNATGFHVSGTSVGDVTGDVTGNIDGNLIGNLTGNVTGNVTGNITGVSTGNVTGDVTGNLTGNLVGAAASVASGANIHAGVVTATTLSGDGSALTGIAATNFNTQTVTANGAETIIDLSDGNCITMNQSANTTVGFASTSTAMDITIIRVKDDNTTARTITWPSSILWNGGSAPTLISSSASGDKQQFQFLTRDGGLTWYGWEPFKYDLDYHAMYAWGDANEGKLGLNSTVDRSSPTQVGTDTTWSVKLGNSGSNTAKAIKTDGSLWTWGAWDDGNSGLNNETNYSSPKQIGTDTNWSNISNTSSMKTAAVTKTDGSLWVWGSNLYGQLGLNTQGDNRSSPAQIPGTWATGDNKITTANPGAMFGIKSDGTLWAQGWSSWFGFANPAGKVSSPTQLGTDSNWDKIAGGGSYYMTAVKTDGTLWTWGHGSGGQLGQGSVTQYSSPRQVGTDTTWDRPFGAQDFSGCLKTDGSLWLWGYGNNGQIGQNNTTNYSSPRQVPGSYVDVCGGGLECSAIKSDGTLWFWGQAGDGQNGNNIGNGSLKYSSPIQVGTNTDWKKISAVIVRGRLGLRETG